jgi:hypothetical protein
MKKLTFRLCLLFTALVLFPATAALAQNTHSVWSTRPLYLTDYSTSTQYSSFISGNMATAWTEGGGATAYFRAYAVVTSSLNYDFELVSVTGTDGDSIDGLYDIKRNGVLVCDDCVGKAYGLSQSVGNYFKLYVGTPAGYAENWHYSGYITRRFDF